MLQIQSAILCVISKQTEHRRGFASMKTYIYNICKPTISPPHTRSPLISPARSSTKSPATRLSCRRSEAQRWTPLVKHNEQSLQENIAEDLQARALVRLNATVAHYQNIFSPKHPIERYLLLETHQFHQSSYSSQPPQSSPTTPESSPGTYHPTQPSN